MLVAVRSESSYRLTEARNCLSYIRSIEIPPPEREPDVVYTLRGLYYVQLYAAWEYSIENAVQATLRAINSHGIEKRHYVHSTLSWVLHPEFSSLSMVGPEKRWRKRKELLDSMNSNDSAQIGDSIFSSEMQNVWPETIRDVIMYLGISTPAIPEENFGGYIHEVVDKRNAVAHGRLSPKQVGITRSSELEKRLEAIEHTVAHIFFILEEHVNNRSFLKPNTP